VSIPTIETDVVVLGAGPGGYTAAFRAADLGLQVVLVERYPELGGVCLNVGCIPSKALLHVARVITEIKELKAHRIDLGNARPDPDSLRAYALGVVRKLGSGLKALAKQRSVRVVQGTGMFTSRTQLRITEPNGTTAIGFRHAIIAAGSKPLRLAGLPEDPRIWDSTQALSLEPFPARLLIIGGGIIGLELGTVYAALGANVTVVEAVDSLLPECDADVVRPLVAMLRKRGITLHLNTTVTAVDPHDTHVTAHLAGPRTPLSADFDAILLAVGRSPNGHDIGANAAEVMVTERGYIPVDEQLRTNVPSIFAIGDIAGPPMLAHKASHQGKIVAEVIAGHKSSFNARVIPAIAYTDPEVAWVGLTETTAQAQGIAYDSSTFPWAANGRSLGLGRNEGLTKLVFDRETNRLLGMQAVGPQAGDLIAEGTLAIEMGCDAHDLALTIHPHPTLSETIALGAEMQIGTITDLYLPALAKAKP
jgi:dihydrolipoamide dehydrogenase